MTFFRHLTALTGVGVGGGSLVYCNTLPTPGEDFFTAPEWGGLADWPNELEHHYETARSMLGSKENPHLTRPDHILKAMADERGRSEHFHPTPVAVYFGKPNVTVRDPYFGGVGPDRTGCTTCGACMTGCRVGAKNTLDRNYLWLAERVGTEIRADTEVTWISPLADGSGDYEIKAKERLGAFRKRNLTFRAKNVVLAGGVLGTIDLLLRLKQHPQGLPAISEKVGDRVRTNSEVLIGITTQRRDVDMSEGVSITSIFHTDEHSFVEPTRFGAGSGFFRTLSTPHAPGRGFRERMVNLLRRTLGDPLGNLRAFLVPDWARYTCVLLYMRTQEGFIRLTSGRSIGSWFRTGLRVGQGGGTRPDGRHPRSHRVGR